MWEGCGQVSVTTVGVRKGTFQVAVHVNGQGDGVDIF